MKRIIALALAVIMALSLCACGAKADKPAASGDKIELTFWGHQEDSWVASYTKIIEAYEKDHPNVKINCEFFPYDEYESKVQTSLISKSGGADIYELWGGWGVDFASTGALAPMPDDMAKEVMSDAYAPTYGALEYEGKLYGMPMEFNIEAGALLVNNHILEQGGYSIPATWDELVKTAREATVVDGNGMYQVKGFDFVNWDSVPYLFTSMILSQGGRYLNEDGSVNVTSPEAGAVSLSAATTRTWAIRRTAASSATPLPGTT